MSKPRPPDETPPHGGRPKALEPGTSLTTWVPLSEYDRLVKLANAKDQSLSALVRDWLRLKR